MKKAVLIALVVFAFVVPAFAGFDVSVFGGYTTVKMNKVNDEFINTLYEELSADYLADDPANPISKTNLGNAIFMGVDFSYLLMPGLSVGPRIEYIGLYDSRIFCEYPANEQHDKMLTGGSLLPVMVGASYAMTMSQALSVGASVYAGYGFAYMYFKQDSYNGYLPDGRRITEMTGGCVAGDIEANAKYKITNLISVSLKVGYRLAASMDMTYVDNVWDLDITKGDTIEDQNGDPMPVDYSGLIAGLDIGFAF